MAPSLALPRATGERNVCGGSAGVATQGHAEGESGGVDVYARQSYGGWLVKIRLPAAMNMPPTPWQKETWTPGTWWAASPRT